MTTRANSSRADVRSRPGRRHPPGRTKTNVSIRRITELLGGTGLGQELDCLGVHSLIGQRGAMTMRPSARTSALGSLASSSAKVLATARNRKFARHSPMTSAGVRVAGNGECARKWKSSPCSNARRGRRRDRSNSAYRGDPGHGVGDDAPEPQRFFITFAVVRLRPPS